MRTPKEIYAAYQIMPNLQLHQLRVAAVGECIADYFKESVHARDVVLACLFHDMGNIVKFKLREFPESAEPEGVEYWERVKAKVAETYGADQHRVSEAMAREIGLPETVVRMIGSAGYSHIGDILRDGPLELQILQYADLRVAPTGVVSLEERFADFARRYPEFKGNPTIAQEAGRELERQVLGRTTIKPEDITDATVIPAIEQLWEYPVTSGADVRD